MSWVIKNLFSSDKIIFSIGDEGTVLNIFKNGALALRAFARLNVAEEIQIFNNILAQESKLPMYILIDNIEQNYNRQSLPAVSSLTINNIIQKKLERAVPIENLRAFKLLGRSEEVRTEWHFLLISAPLAEPLQSWLQLILNYPCPFKGLYTVPMELTGLIHKLAKIYLPIPKKSKPEVLWQLFICHNKVSGFRQVACKNGKIIFSRLIHTLQNDSADFLAGNIEQEVANSIEYLQRLSYRKENRLDIYIVTSSEIKYKLSNLKFKATNVVLLTPFEVAEAVKLPKAALQEDKFADVVIASNFANTLPPVLRLHHPKLDKIILLETITKLVRLPKYILIPLFFSYASFSMMDVVKSQRVINKLLDEKIVINREWDKYQQIAKEQEDKLKIVELVNIYQKLTSQYQTPFNILEKLKAILNDAITIEHIDWKLVTNKEINTVVVTFRVNIANTSRAYNQLFDSVNKFIRDITTTFAEYNIDYNRTNEKISFGGDIKSIPLQVTMSGPKTQ